MIATVFVTFVDAPPGRKEKKFFVGDVVEISRNDFDRISGQNKDLLKEGKHDLGTGICYPCIKNTKKSKR